ncbi:MULTISPECIES: TolC family protein [unclassified Limnohabitans]|jgi:cobalt-zinc-cadmium efflux system outer membrane protein|uniref:TolC family protein n=1 Tax=unclassified Limnohabitans TaxID=2626134 RepID=UPI000D3483AA|nr:MULTISPECIES: TolC family protein [unclassified Limnohabitans]
MSIRHLFLWSGLAALGLSPWVLAADAISPTAAPSLGTPAPASSVLGLQEVLQAARQSPEVLAAQRAVNAARAEVLSADRAPAPTLSAGVASIDLQNGNGSGSFWSQKRIDKSLGLDWTWERGNKRALRTETAAHSANAAQADSQEVLLLQQINAQAAFYDLLAAQQRLQAVQAIGQSAKQLAHSAQLRLKAGDLSAQDAARIQIEAERSRAEEQSAALDRQQAVWALSQFTGLAVPRGGWQVQGEWPASTADTAQADALLETLIEQRPNVIAARERLAAAQTALQSAQALRQTDPSIGTSFDHFPGTSTRLMALRISMPLNGWQRFDGDIARALAQEEQSQALLQKTLLQAHADLGALVQARQISAQRLQIFESSILIQATQVAAQAETAYNKGGLTLTDLLDARRTLKTIQLEALAARNAHAKALGAWQLRLAMPGRAH